MYIRKQMHSIILREIQKADDPVIANIIRNTLAEFGANRPGTVFFDSTTDHLYETFQSADSIYFIAELNGEIVGGAGIFHSAGLPEDTCELVKMYLLPQARGIGIGRRLLDSCLDAARRMHFKKCYLETLPELHDAIALYEANGFVSLSQPIGNTGHFGCDIWMIKTL